VGDERVRTRLNLERLGGMYREKQAAFETVRSAGGRGFVRTWFTLLARGGCFEFVAVPNISTRDLGTHLRLWGDVAPQRDRGSYQFRQNSKPTSLQGYNPPSSNEIRLSYRLLYKTANGGEGLEGDVLFYCSFYLGESINECGV